MLYVTFLAFENASNHAQVFLKNMGSLNQNRVPTGLLWQVP